MSEIERVTFRVLRRDKLALQQLAGDLGEPVAVILRRLVREEVRRRDGSLQRHHSDGRA
jgi:hypothetical protein